jgi:hypothetical protein
MGEPVSTLAKTFDQTAPVRSWPQVPRFAPTSTPTSPELIR